MARELLGKYWFLFTGISKGNFLLEKYLEERQMKKYFKLVAALFFVVCLARTASAASISYTSEDLGNNLWQYNYTIYNNSQSDIDFFDIYFDDSYDELHLLNYPDGWWTEVLEADDMNPLMLSGMAWDVDPLLPGNSLGLFSVVFNWLGIGTPGGQEFALYNFAENGFDPVVGGFESGVYTEETAPPVPEPQTFMLLGTGLVGLAAYYRRKQARKAGK